MESKNLKCEWDVLRKWIYFEANFKNRSAFLKVGQWNKMAQTPSPVRDTVVTVTLVLEVRILPIRCFALFKMNIHVITLIFPGIHDSISHFKLDAAFLFKQAHQRAEQWASDESIVQIITH